MARDWETWLRNSIGPASATEEQDRDRTEQRIRNAITVDSRLAGKVRVFAKGSYANNTNVRRDSDVDIAVEWNEWSYITKANEAAELPWERLGVRVGTDLGPQPGEFRRWVESALLSAFGSAIVDTSGSKHIHVIAGSTTLDADVVPCFRLLRYDRPGGTPHQGIRLYPKLGGTVENWPEQKRTNGVTKNNNMSRRYKQLVRAMKRLENDMVQNGRLPEEVHGYFIECLLYNIPNATFTDRSYKATAKNILAVMWQTIENGGANDWVEVNNLKWLWRSGQTWTPEEASNFAYQAWNYINES